jgi:Domain of unknown function (DUF6265)
MKHAMALGPIGVIVAAIVVAAGLPPPLTLRRTAVALAEAGQPRATTQSPRKAIPATIGQVAWMEGTWIGKDGVTVEERWTPPAGGAMLAVSRTVKDGRMVAFEFLRIVERDGGLVYVAQPGGKPPTDFTLTALAGTSATFENPGHDFPKLIRYTKRPDGSLEAHVGDGGARDETYVFRRVQ